MTETRTGLGACSMGSKSASPCPFPATVELPGRLPEGVGLCAYHAATQPLAEEHNDLGIALELLEGYLKDAREYDNPPLVRALERVRADLGERFELAEKVVEDLRAADLELFRR